MIYLLDTNAVIRMLDGDPILVRALRLHRQSDVVVSSLVMTELFFGASRSRRVNENLARIERIPLEVLPFEAADALAAAEIRAGLVKAGTPIGPYDVLIAGHAKARDLVLVTHNTREFGRIPGLRTEDWQA